MPLVLDPPPSAGALRQGEILSDVYEYQALHPPIENTSNDPLSFQPLQHPFLIVMTADCDLLQDYKARITPPNQEQTLQGVRQERSRRNALLPHILLCELYERHEISAILTEAGLLKRIEDNQIERYHRFTTAHIGNSQVDQLPELFLDFKKILTLPADRLYEGLESSKITRVALVPPIWVHDLMHRFYSFLGRVGVPE